MIEGRQPLDDPQKAMAKWFTSYRDNDWAAYNEVWNEDCYHSCDRWTPNSMNHPIPDSYFYQLKPGDFVIDAGAHIGTWTVLAAEKVGPTGRVFSFEPWSENFYHLVRNTLKYPQVTVFNLALWNLATKHVFNFYDWSGSNSLHERPSEKHGQIEISAVPLDIFQRSDRRVAFIKIDTEGAEPEIMQGAANILTKDRPYIAMEMHADVGQGWRGVFDTLDKYNYAHMGTREPSQNLVRWNEYARPR